VFGLLVVSAVYVTLTFSLRKHILERARIMALNVSDGAPGYILKNSAPGLRELLRKHANRPELAYIMVENRGGEIFSHSFAVLPDEIRGASSNGDPAERTLQLGGGAVHEVSVPIMDGRIGKVRVGVWRDRVDAEIHAAVIPLVKLLIAVVGCAMALAVFLAWRINRPIFRLVRTAKAISAGDLDVPSVRIEDPTEFSELSRALERMRSSVKAAMTRLGR
jgi:two-component system sensor histidine kinase VicK